MRRLGALLLATALILGPASGAAAVTVSPDEQLDDPALEARAREVSRMLRCIVCESQSIDESNAGMAQDLRELVRERIVAGDTNEQVIDYVVSRYGEYVLLAPRMEGRTLLLWGAPLIFLAVGGALLFVVLRQAAAAPIDYEPLEEPQS